MTEQEEKIKLALGCLGCVLCEQIKLQLTGKYVIFYRCNWTQNRLYEFNACEHFHVENPKL